MAVEKPFGRDRASTQALNRAPQRVFDEPAIFRFAKAFLEPIWNRNCDDHVQITMAEQFGVEGDRGSCAALPAAAGRVRRVDAAAFGGGHTPA